MCYCAFNKKPTNGEKNQRNQAKQVLLNLKIFNLNFLVSFAAILQMERRMQIAANQSCKICRSAIK